MKGLNGYSLTRYSAIAPVDPDAKRFINATGITGVQAKAIDTFVKGAKFYGLWSLMFVVYPMVGGTSGTHKFNLMAPYDADASYRLVFHGSPTHDANGVSFNGVNQYAETFFVQPSGTVVGGLGTGADVNDLHMAYYSFTDNTNLGYEMGAVNSGYSVLSIHSDNSAGWRSMAAISSGNGRVTTNLGSSKGCFIMSSFSAIATMIYWNGIYVISANDAGLPAPTSPFFLGAANNGGSPVYSDKGCGFATIGHKLTGQQVVTLNYLIKKFQNTLGRG